MLTFYVPPGIGDFSAMYSKLCLTEREITIRCSSDGPRRLGPFLDILTKVKNGGYSGFTADVSVKQTLPAGTDLASLPDGDYFLAINSWLEQGGTVADWVPGKIEYHYMTPEYASNAEGDRIAGDFYKELPQESPVVGIYCSAYGNSRHWNFWVYPEWKIFLELIVRQLPRDTSYLFLGAEYDLAISDTLHNWMQSEGYKSYLLLGAFEIGTTIEVIRRLDYFFSFPSGLGFLADVVNTPNTMWLPNHLMPMAGTFCDPNNYAKGLTVHEGFTFPEAAFVKFGSSFRFLEDRWQNRKSLSMK